MKRLISISLVIAVLFLAPTAYAQSGLSKGEIEHIQRMLNDHGYDTGKPDGAWGSNSAKALRAYQRDWGLPETGVLTKALYDRINHQHPDTDAQWLRTSAGCDAWIDHVIARMSITWTGGCSAGKASGSGQLAAVYNRNGSTFTYFTYNGGISGGKYEGHGTYYDKDGFRYEGAWSGGLRHGQGVADYEDGSRYDGGWQKGLRHGHGSYTGPNGTNLTGQWTEGGFNGIGKVAYTDGTYDEGQWSNGKLHGRGRETIPMAANTKANS